MESRQRLLFCIRQYLENEVLGPRIEGKVDVKHLERCSVEELEEKLIEIDVVLSNQTNSNLVDGMLRGGMETLEQLAIRYDMDISGATETLFRNDHWRFLLERVKFMYGLNYSPTIDPALELTLVTFQTLMLVYRRNSLSKVKTNLDKMVAPPSPP